MRSRKGRSLPFPVLLLALLGFCWTSLASPQNYARRHRQAPRRSQNAEPSSTTTLSSIGTPAPTYVPAVHWKLDRYDLDHLEPKYQTTLMYGHPEANISSGIIHAAFTDVKSKFPMVPLEHSSHVHKVQCLSATSLAIHFNTLKAFEVSLRWPKQEFILVGHGYEGCASFLETDERFWIMVKDITHDEKNLSLTCHIEAVQIEDVAEEVEINWGAHVMNKTAVQSHTPGFRSFELQRGTEEPQMYKYRLKRSVVKAREENLHQFHKRAACNRDNLFRSMAQSTSLASSFCKSYLPKSTTVLTDTTLTLTPPKKTVVSTILKSVQSKVIILETKTETPISKVEKTASTETIKTSVVTKTVTDTASETLTTSVLFDLEKREPEPEEGGAVEARQNKPPVWATSPASSISSACSCVVSIFVPTNTKTITTLQAAQTVTSKSTLTSTYTVTVQPTKRLGTVTITTTVATDVRTFTSVLTSYETATTTLIVQTTTIPIYPSFSGPSIPDFDVEDVEILADFDQMLDDLLGYMDPSDSGFWDTFAPGFMTSGKGVMLVKRWGLGDLWDAFVEHVIDPIAEAFEALGRAIVAGVMAVISLIPPIPITPMYLNFGFDIDPKYLDYDWAAADTPFGEGVQMYKEDGFGLYCVDCKLEGHFYTLATFSYHLGSNSITKGLIEFSNRFYLSLGIAMVFDRKTEDDWEKTLLEFSAGGLVIPSIITIGPSVEISLGAEGSASVFGGVMTGFVFEWSPSVSINFIDIEKSYARGKFIPTFDRIFKLETGITAKAEVFVLAKIAFGVNLFKGAAKLQASFNEQPGLEAEMTFKLGEHTTTAEPDDDEEEEDEDCLNGVGVGLTFKNEIFIGMEVFGANFKLPFHEHEVPLVDWCFALPDDTPTGPGGGDPTTTTAEPTTTLRTTTMSRSPTPVPAVRLNLESRGIHEAFCPDAHMKTFWGGRAIAYPNSFSVQIWSPHYLAICGYAHRRVDGRNVGTAPALLGACLEGCFVAANGGVSPRCSFGVQLVPSKDQCLYLSGASFPDQFETFAGEKDTHGYETQMFKGARQYGWRNGYNIKGDIGGTLTGDWRLLSANFEAGVYPYPNNTKIVMVIVPNTSFAGYNITTIQTVNFGECMSRCIEYEGEKQCVAVTYDSLKLYPYRTGASNFANGISFDTGLCHMKSAAYNSTQEHNPWAYSAYAGAYGLARAPDLTKCPGRDGQYHVTPNSKIYFFRCSTVIWGWTASTHYTANFDACINLCSVTAGCVATTWWPDEEKPCHLKNQFWENALQVRTYPNSMTAIWTEYVIPQ